MDAHAILEAVAIAMTLVLVIVGRHVAAMLRVEEDALAEVEAGP